jgi:hypothetical protein
MPNDVEAPGVDNDEIMTVDEEYEQIVWPVSRSIVCDPSEDAAIEFRRLAVDDNVYEHDDDLSMNVCKFFYCAMCKCRRQLRDVVYLQIGV